LVHQPSRVDPSGDQSRLVRLAHSNGQLELAVPRAQLKSAKSPAGPLNPEPEHSLAAVEAELELMGVPR
jgi:hypothetical protein